jgi:hypothetical protein
MGIPFDIDREDVRQAGWAIVFHADEDQAVKDALAPLIEHRREQIGDHNIVKVLEYRDGDQVVPWLARHKVKFGPVEPERAPYYLLLVGGPERIPFAFSQLLSVIYAVGRLSFEGVAQYRQYAQSVIEYEKSNKTWTGRDVIFFGPRHKTDMVTKFTSEFLIKSLSDDKFIARLNKVARVGYNGVRLRPEESTKAALHNILHPAPGSLAPSLLLVACHGMQRPFGDPQQTITQGALVCQEYEGQGQRPNKPEDYFAASDLSPDAHLFGMVCFLFASYSVGTPDQETMPGGSDEAVAPKPFFSALAKALLSHPKGGALGVYGLVSRGWLPSSDPEVRWSYLTPFENALGSILSGKPLGLALSDFYERFSNLTVTINTSAETLSDRRFTPLLIERASVDAFVLFGDPAAHLNMQSST